MAGLPGRLLPGVNVSSHRKLKETYNLPGHAHFLTFSCQHRLPLLAKDNTRRWLAESLDAARVRHDVALLAYVFMPEHAHVLVHPRRDEYTIERFLADVKRPVSWKAKQHLIATRRTDWIDRLTVRKGGRDVFRFWLQGGGYDQNVTDQWSIPQMAAYAHLNPVRRGLVTDPLEWMWSSARSGKAFGPCRWRWMFWMVDAARANARPGKPAMAQRIGHRL